MRLERTNGDFMMFGEIGKKIKILITVVVILTSLLCIIMGTCMLFDANRDQSMRILGVILAVAGPISCWISGFLIYGFGELIDKVCTIEKRLSEIHHSLNLPRDNEWKSEEEMIDEICEDVQTPDEPLYNPVRSELQSKTPPSRGH